MATPTAVVVSFRLGGDDGVAVEARKWQTALEAIGFRVRRVAGELQGPPRPDDIVLAGLGLPAAELTGGSPMPPAPPTASALRRALAGADLVVVENLLSLPLNLPAAMVLAAVLTDGANPRTLVHHHDLPWQRDRTADLADFPPALPHALHVTINDASRESLLTRRGITATTIRNCFDLDSPLGDRTGGRAVIGAAPSDLVVLHPVRAIARKNIPAAVALCNELARRFPDREVRYWLPGPAEEGYGPTLDDVLTHAEVAVHRQPVTSMADAYAACDLVVFPSIWEGFGNPVIESVWARRPLAVARYPVLEELVAKGFAFLDAADPETVAAAIADPDEGVFDANLALARRWHSRPALERQLRDLLHWQQWLPPTTPDPTRPDPTTPAPTTPAPTTPAPTTPAPTTQRLPTSCSSAASASRRRLPRGSVSGTARSWSPSLPSSRAPPSTSRGGSWRSSWWRSCCRA